MAAQAQVRAGVYERGRACEDSLAPFGREYSLLFGLVRVPTRDAHCNPCPHPQHHAHKCVRIPKVDKSEGERYGLGNREGRLICRLCSGKAGNRNTSWMCSTCCVPLCVDLKATGDERTSCLARWHLCRDLVAENAERNHALSEKRASSKRSREEEEGGVKMDPVGIETHVAEVPAPVIDHDPIVNMV